MNGLQVNGVSLNLTLIRVYPTIRLTGIKDATNTISTTFIVSFHQTVHPIVVLILIGVKSDDKSVYF